MVGFVCGSGVGVGVGVRRGADGVCLRRYGRNKGVRLGMTVKASLAAGWTPGGTVEEKMDTVEGKEGLGRLRRDYEGWCWREYHVNYKVEGPVDAEMSVMLVHGFGACVNHWYDLQSLLASEGYRVYSIDLLGFGASEKPRDVEYGIDMWTDMLEDFVREQGGTNRWLLTGNSIGSLIAMNTAKRLGKERVAGVCLFNCPGGLTVFRYEELSWPLRILYFGVRKLFFNPLVGQLVFENYRRPHIIKDTLLAAYGNKEAVTDDRVEMIYMPTTNPNAPYVFTKVIDGPAGPKPETLLTSIQWCPVLVIWGEEDPWTSISSKAPLNFHPGDQFHLYHPSLLLVPFANTGHCPHDERPKWSHQHIMQWLQKTVHSKQS